MLNRKILALVLPAVAVSALVGSGFQHGILTQILPSLVMM